jgi:hypothetical protein
MDPILNFFAAGTVVGTVVGTAAGTVVGTAGTAAGTAVGIDLLPAQQWVDPVVDPVNGYHTAAVHGGAILTY